MQTAPDTELIQFEGWTLRIRRSTQRADGARLLVMIHGISGDENSMWVFARELPAHYRIVAPRAPHAVESGGYSWRLPEGAVVADSSYEFFLPAAEDLIRLMDEYSHSAGIDASTFDVMGFSQGAVMANVLAFLYPQRIRRAGILAGFVPKGLEETATKRPLQGKHFFVAHGTKDETVTIDRARASLKILEQAGAQVTYCEDEVGHKVSANCLRALKHFFS